MTQQYDTRSEKQGGHTGNTGSMERMNDMTVNVKERNIEIDDTLASAYKDTFGEELDTDILETYLSLHTAEPADIQTQLVSDIQEDIIVNGGSYIGI